MVSDKLQILKELFLGFGRNPNANKDAFEFYLDKSSGADPRILKKAVDELLSTCQTLPRVMDLVNAIKRLAPVKESKSVDCKICGKGGLIYSVFCRQPDGDFREVYSLDQKILKGSTYTSIIIGRCSCLNGSEYAGSSSEILSRIVEPPSYLENNDWDTAYQAGYLARKLNSIANNFKKSIAKPLQVNLEKYDKS
tara:strand:- start:204 stop:788 length:585 start_codon:yes stop_codon:yes gene_type:complete